MLKKIMLILLISIGGFNTYASDLNKIEVLNTCVNNRKCEIINTLWMMSKGELLIFIPKDIRKKWVMIF